MKRHITLLVLTLPLLACGGDDGGGTSQQGNNAMTGDCDGPNALTYETFGKSFFDQYCNDCHGSSGTHTIAPTARGAGTFDTASQIQDAADAIEDRAILASGATMMPPSYAEAFPSEAERNQLAEWLACGAP